MCALWSVFPKGWGHVLLGAVISTSCISEVGSAAEVTGSVVVPSLKIVESKTGGRKFDAFLFSSVGAGVTINYSKFSWSPVALLFSGDTSKDQGYDMALASILGAANNKFQLGYGYDFGTVQGRGRVFLLASFGINLGESEKPANSAKGKVSASGRKDANVSSYSGRIDFSNGSSKALSVDLGAGIGGSMNYVTEFAEGFAISADADLVFSNVNLVEDGVPTSNGNAWTTSLDIGPLFSVGDYVSFSGGPAVQYSRFKDLTWNGASLDASTLSVGAFGALRVYPSMHSVALLKVEVAPFNGSNLEDKLAGAEGVGLTGKTDRGQSQSRLAIAFGYQF